MGSIEVSSYFKFSIDQFSSLVAGLVATKKASTEGLCSLNFNRVKLTVDHILIADLLRKIEFLFMTR